MTRLALILVFAACSSKQPPVPVPVHSESPCPAAAGSAVSPVLAQPVSSEVRNFVCERLHAENEKAPCEPEYTDVGELHTHTARITIQGQTVACAINAQQVSVVCGPLFYVAPPSKPADDAALKPEAKPDPKAGPKK